MALLFHEVSQPDNIWFTSALGLMLILGLLQTLSLLIGVSVSGFLDDLVPEPVDGEGVGVGSDGVLSALLSWLNIGKVPVIVSLIGFLFIFAFIGLNGQGLLALVIGVRLPALISVPAATICSLPFLRYLNAGIARIMPRDETAAVSSHAFIGRVATISLGKAAVGRPAEAKLRGPLGRMHYIMVEPDVSGVEFLQGDEVLVVKRLNGAHFTVIAIDNTNLTDRKKKL